MANNRVTLVSGNADKREQPYVGTTTIYGGTFVMPVAGGVDLPTAGYDKQIAIADFTSLDGMNSRMGEQGMIGYNENDQIPILYPTNGCYVNVLTKSDTIVDGDGIGIDAEGLAVSGGTIGIARGESTSVPGSDDYFRVLVEVLK